MLQPLLCPDDPAPFAVRCPEGGAPLLIVCDHASKAVPASLRALGLPKRELDRHIGWDIGAAMVAEGLSQALGATAILAGYSRLVIDCNRDPDDPTSIPEASDGTEVPGNRALSTEARAARRSAIFDPYHAAIDAWLKARLDRGIVPSVLSIHSFTPTMNGRQRPWHVGILWDVDPRIPVPLMAALRREPDLIVGDNEPYSARSPAGYTVRHHVVPRGLPHAAIEVRQDLIAATADGAVWTRRLADALVPILARPDLRRVRD